MRIDYSQKTQFYGIHVINGGEEFVYREGGLNALTKLNIAKEEFKRSKWNLYVDKKGYTLESPNQKSYVGPFSVKRIFLTGEARKSTTKLIVRMDKANRIKYSVFIPTKVNLDKWYKLIKTSNGLDKMLNILKVLETSFR